MNIEPVVCRGITVRFVGVFPCHLHSYFCSVQSILKKFAVHGYQALKPHLFSLNAIAAMLPEQNFQLHR